MKTCQRQLEGEKWIRFRSSTNMISPNTSHDHGVLYERMQQSIAIFSFVLGSINSNVCKEASALVDCLRQFFSTLLSKKLSLDLLLLKSPSSSQTVNVEAVLVWSRITDENFFLKCLFETLKGSVFTTLLTLTLDHQ